MNAYDVREIVRSEVRHIDHVPFGVGVCCFCMFVLILGMMMGMNTQNKKISELEKKAEEWEAMNAWLMKTITDKEKPWQTREKSAAKSATSGN